MLLLPLLASALFTLGLFAGVPLARAAFPSRDEAFWQLAGLAASCCFFALVTALGLLAPSTWARGIASVAFLLWIGGAVVVGGYRPTREGATPLFLYVGLAVVSIAYQDLMVRARLPFPFVTAVGYPIDNFIPLWASDVITHRSDPDTFALYPEWHFSDRTPLQPLIQSFLFQLLGIDPALDAGRPWILLRTYLFSSSCLNALAIISSYWFLRGRLPERSAILATLLVALAPFTLINVYFSWPKLFATFFFLAAMRCLGQRSEAWPIAGFLALAFLAHAMYVVFLPGFLLHAYLAARRDTGLERAVVASARILGGFALCVAPWFLWTHLVYGNPSDKFLRYPFAIYYHRREVMESTARVLETFLQTPVLSIFWVRVVNAVQSLLPVSLGLVPSDFPGDQRAIGYNLLRYYWTTIPGTLSLTALPLCYVAVYRAWKREPGFCVAFLLLPFLVHLGLFGFIAEGGGGGEIGRNEGQLFGPILAGFLSLEIARLSPRARRCLAALLPLEFAGVVALNFAIATLGGRSVRLAPVVLAIAAYALFVVWFGRERLAPAAPRAQPA